MSAGRVSCRRLVISVGISVLRALRRVSGYGEGLLLIFSRKRCFNLIDVKSVRHTVVNGGSLSAPVGGVLQSEVVATSSALDLSRVEALVVSCEVRFVPVLGAREGLIGILV